MTVHNIIYYFANTLIYVPTQRSKEIKTLLPIKQRNDFKQRFYYNSTNVH